MRRVQGELSITNIGTGGASVPSELVHGAKRALPTINQGSGWGMTETCAIGTVIGGPDYLAFPLSCGRAHQVVDLKLIDPDTLQEVPEGAAGELCIRSPTMMRSYWNNPKETEAVMLPGALSPHGRLAAKAALAGSRGRRANLAKRHRDTGLTTKRRRVDSHGRRGPHRRHGVGVHHRPHQGPRHPRWREHFLRRGGRLRVFNGQGPAH